MMKTQPTQEQLAELEAIFDDGVTGH